MGTLCVSWKRLQVFCASKQHIPNPQDGRKRQPWRQTFEAVLTSVSMSCCKPEAVEQRGSDGKFPCPTLCHTKSYYKKYLYFLSNFYKMFLLHVYVYCINCGGCKIMLVSTQKVQMIGCD